MRTRTYEQGPPRPLVLSQIDLFAGCGGLGLGLELAGFTPLAAVELNDSARASYLANRAHIGVKALANVARVSKLSETELRGALGLNGRQRVAIVTGGPPCQGFSRIGHRRTNGDVERHEIVSNHLYRDMIRVIRKVRPETFLFENVQGILSARWSRDKKDKVWDRVRRSFVRVLGNDYVIAFELVRGYDYGVPQHRPRVLMLGMRKPLFKALGGPIPADAINRATSLGNAVGIECGLIPAPLAWADVVPDLADLLGDLTDPTWTAGVTRRTECYPQEARTEWQRAMRSQNAGDDHLLKAKTPVSEHEYSIHSEDVTKRFELIRTDKDIPEKLQIKKFAQRRLREHWDASPPNFTVASLPDDFVHYAQARTLTVREWARLQGFPDWYEFRGPRTTGGHRRAGDVRSGDSVREAPKYTQIGNAVPVPLAAAVGWHVRKLLRIDAEEPLSTLQATRLGELLGERFR